MAKKILNTKEAPEPIGPYAQAVEWNGLIFTSGQIALDAKLGEIVGVDAATQAEKVIENLKSVLEAANCSLDNVLKTTIYLKNMDDFAAVNEIYAQYFSKALPARSTVEVSKLPKNVLVEMDCIACGK